MLLTWITILFIMLKRKVENKMTQMKSNKKMKAVITKIAEVYGLDLKADESHLRLESEGYMPLVIKKIGKNRVSVAHYYTQQGDAMRDPEVCFVIIPSLD